MTTTTTRLARLAIELSGLTPDPRSLAALEAAERGGATDDTFALAKAATEDARGQRAENVGLAVEAAVGAQVFPAQADAFVCGAATCVMDAVRLHGLHAARPLDGDAHRAALRAITPALRTALARVREILPGYEPDEDARSWIDRPAVRTYEVEGAGADQTVEGTSSEDAAHEAAAIQYGALGAVTVRFVDRGSDSATLGVYEVEVDGVPQARRLVVREASRRARGLRVTARVIVGRPRVVARVRKHDLHAVTVALRGATEAQYDAADRAARAHPWASCVDGGWEVRQVPDPATEAVVDAADRDAVTEAAARLAESVRGTLGPRTPGRPVADWRTLLPTLWRVVQSDAPAWVSERTRELAARLLAALTADVEGAIEKAGGAAAAEPVTSIDRNLISRWRRQGILRRE